MSRPRQAGDPSRAELAALLGLADGSLPAEAQAEAEARLRAAGWGDDAVERQRPAVHALRESTLTAPPELHARVTRQLRPAPRRAPRPRLVGGLATGLVGVLIVALALVLGSGSDGAGPTVAQVVRVGAGPAAEPAPPTGDRARLRRTIEGTAFPNWRGGFGWIETGARSDMLADRRAETVFYTHHGHRIAYTIVAGDPLDVPRQAEARRVAGAPLHVYADGGRDVVVFERDGKTCVLSGRVLRQETLVKLAASELSSRVPRTHLN